MNFYELVDNKTLNINTLQINIGKMCNLSCGHCHVKAGPHRIEMMSKDTFDKCIKVYKNFNLTTLDITGGEPTVHPNIIYFLTEACNVSKNVILRTNGINIDKSTELLSFLNSHNVSLTISLPCYTKENVDSIRGEGSFKKIIKSIHILNSIGYGKEKNLNLVYNPMGAYLPPNQKELEHDYKDKLSEFDITFSKLLCIANLPIGNFKHYLEENNCLSDYMDLLKNNFNPSTSNNIMCKLQISVGYDGKLYDCDFNQMENIFCNKYNDINQLLYESCLDREINFKNYCFACTAGAGSSCGGSLDE